MTDTTLDVYRKLSAYREGREHIFQSEGSLQWFVRKHRHGLVGAGALVLLSGQWHAHEQRFDAYVAWAGEQAAKRLLVDAAI